jgi:hypothetical protein
MAVIRKSFPYVCTALSIYKYAIAVRQNIILIAIASTVATMSGKKMASTQDQALSMLERVTEPVFIPKGDKNIVFDVPSEYLVSNCHLFNIVFTSL